MLHLGDNIEVIKTLPDNSVDAVITDSPYGLGAEPDPVSCLQNWIDHGYYEVKGAGFMGKHWDAFVPQPVLWKECLRVLKPGGHLLSFFGTRTYDWGTLAIRLAGFEIRDCILWVYGSGFPKSLDVSKAIDKAAGAQREKGTPRRPIGTNKTRVAQGHRPNEVAQSHESGPAITEDAKRWDGYGTALKPACEPICVARKPLIGTVVENVLKHGTGAINIDAGRVGTQDESYFKTNSEPSNFNGNTYGYKDYENMHKRGGGNTAGRWPANLIHDGSDEVSGLFPYTKSGSLTGQPRKENKIYSSAGATIGTPLFTEKSEGSAARFFYCAKASPAERAGRKHPTIKPLALMEYLVKVFCPAGGTVLDPHAGSGTTGVACINQGMRYILIDNDPASYAEAKKFIDALYWGGL